MAVDQIIIGEIFFHFCWTGFGDIIRWSSELVVEKDDAYKMDALHASCDLTLHRLRRSAELGIYS